MDVFHCCQKCRVAPANEARFNGQGHFHFRPQITCQIILRDLMPTQPPILTPDDFNLGTNEAAFVFFTSCCGDIDLKSSLRQIPDAAGKEGELEQNSTFKLNQPFLPELCYVYKTPPSNRVRTILVQSIGYLMRQ
ncbi:hypothetical protein J6590_023877 [Homalodisca vitripennis]|nr:hypothetical protein J6590_023877 [Homalodisca vitripennis]